MARKSRYAAATAALCGTLALPGCWKTQFETRSDFLYLNTRQVPCRHDDTEIEILGTPPKSPFERLALVEASALYATEEASWATLRAEVCRLAIEAGGDALIELTTRDAPYSWELTLGLLGVSRSGTLRRLTGVAIEYSASAVPTPGGGGAPTAPEPAEPSSGPTSKSR
jgi:hypothetical protein